MKSQVKDPKELVEKSIAFLRRMGMKMVVMEPNRVELMAPILGNENHIGTLYAGALFSIAEASGGVLFYATFDFNLFYPIVKEVQIKFFRPATTDVTVEIVMDPDEARRISLEAMEKGKADFEIAAEVINTRGEVVAATNSIYQIRSIEYGKDLHS